MTSAGNRVLVLLLGLWCGPLLGAVTATVDTRDLTMGESLTLTVSADAGEDLDLLDLAPLQGDFIVADRSSTTRITIADGRRQSVSEVVIALFPRRSGSLAIPALSVGAVSTLAVPLRVRPSSLATKSLSISGPNCATQRRIVS